jgi:NAD(P)-dependent dehydrogenase (short-subunit alcohol dehydrogenase family)
LLTGDRYQMSFQSKVALVTGAGAGIGLETALAFGKLGAKVVLVDANPRNGEEAKKAFESKGYVSMLCIAAVEQSDQVQKVIEDVALQWGRLDILVNNAGIYIQGGVAETNQLDWEKILAVNLTGAFLFTKYALTLMIKNGGGVVINVASEAGLVGIKNQVAYNVSKAGMIGLTRSCAVDLAPLGIRVNSVCPGTTDTPLVQAAIRRADDPAAARRQLEKVRPLNRLGRSEEIASAIVYLASDEAGYATGSILSIDGGFTAQ